MTLHVQGDFVMRTIQRLGALVCVLAIADNLSAQDAFVDGALFSEVSSVGGGEPLFRYDDQERWKHGYLHIMPYYGGYHSFRPYNYHHVFNQSQTASGWGMSPVAPYSQQFWHRYAHLTDLSRGNHSPVAPQPAPVIRNDLYPPPQRPVMTDPSAYAVPPSPLTVPAVAPVQYQPAGPAAGGPSLPSARAAW